MAHSKKLQFILNKLYELNPDKIHLKLDRVQRLINDLGNPHKKLKNVITVTGTNGKGGIAFYLKEIFKENIVSIIRQGDIKSELIFRSFGVKKFFYYINLKI